MASKVKHNFKESALALLRGDWCNRVARRVSYWMGVNGIDVSMPDTPSGNDPIKVGLNVPNAAQILAGEMLSKNLLGRMAGVPFSLTPVLNTAKTDVASLNVYLPTLDFDFGGVTYTVETGSGTGYVTRLDSNGPWYRINGFTTGDVYLVDDSTSTANRMKFATSAPTDDKAYIKLGTVTFNSTTSTASVSQYEHPMRGAVDFGGVGKVGENPKFRKVDGATVTAGDTSVMHHDGVPSGAKFALKTDEWKYGEDEKGFRLLTVSRIEVDDENDPAEHYMYFRCETRDSSGRTVHIGPEIGCAKIMA